MTFKKIVSRNQQDILRKKRIQEETLKQQENKIKIAIRKKKKGWFCIISIPEKNILRTKYLGKTKEEAKRNINKMLQKADIPVERIKFTW